MKCGRKCEVYSRVVGYYRPTFEWNVGKREEFNERKMYKVPQEVESVPESPKDQEVRTAKG